MLAAALLLSAPNRASALEFQCVEPSRYKNLLQIFHDDPSAFFNYFNIAQRQRLPAPDTCRALLVTGTITPESAEALLRHVIEANGWLAMLFLAFGGSNGEQEATIATIVRQFSLKTYELRGLTHQYQPDFMVRWMAPVGKAGFLSARATADPSPLDSGLAAFMNRRDRMFKLDTRRFGCTESCQLVWSAGVNRMRNRRARPPAAPVTHNLTDRLRILFAYSLDRGRPPVADDPILARGLDRVPITPPIIAAALRKECDAEITIAEGLESRVADAFAAAAAKKFASSAVSAIAPHLNALKRAGARLQQCLAAVHENLRLQAFQTHCPKTCNGAELLETFSKSGGAMLKEAGTL
jgi:hypothetical protein